MTTVPARVWTVSPATVIMEGEFDAHNARLLSDAVRSLPAGRRHVDASRVSFAGTAVLGVLIELQLESPDGSLTVETSPTLQRLVTVAGLAGRPPFG